MAVDPELFIHSADRAALDALKAIPGFTQILKGFMKVWNEKQYRILNMSTFIKVSDQQMDRYRQMLIPICQKLGIAVPDLYVALNPYPNAYTAGDNEPFIVMTSGLLNAIPEELIPTVLAHECGHIACHHVLYTTMGKMILNGATDLLGLSSLITTPIQMAFYYWMRCSEYSADRAAAVCDGSAENTVKMCMCLAGFDKNIPIEPNAEAFMAQALEYKNMVDNSKFNKTLEFLMFNKMNHPLNAVRAYECSQWCKTVGFKYINIYVKEEMAGQTDHRFVPFVKPASVFVGRDMQEVMRELSDMGFTDIRTERSTERSLTVKENCIVSISVNGKTNIKSGDWFEFNSPIVLTFYLPLTYAEERSYHPGQVKVPNSSYHYSGKNYNDVINELRAAGFKNFQTAEQADIKMGLLTREGDVARIAIDHMDRFEKDTWFNENAPVDIRYHVFMRK